MKNKFLHYLAFSLSIFVFSCNKDDDPKPDPILGKWEMEFVKIEIKGNDAAADTINGNYSPFEYVYGTARIRLEFKDDKSFDETYIFVDGSSENLDGEWEKAENTLTLKYEQATEDEVATIGTLDEDELTFSIDQQLQLPDPNFPDDETKYVTVDATLTYNYSK